MKKCSWVILTVYLFHGFIASAQPSAAGNLQLFSDDRTIDLTLATDYKNLFSQKRKIEYQPATITFHLPDSAVISEDIQLEARGHYRKDQCYMPPILLNFKNPTSPKLQSLNKLKLVVGCGTSNDDGQLVVKEALVYKIYNLLTDMSLRIRMLRVTYQDTKGKIKSYTQFGFLLEDMDAMAKKNNCYQVKKQAFNTESTDREQMTLVAIFEYMIGNMDWSVPVYHNIKLMRPVTDSFAMPYAIAYDFDHSGFVNAGYALPPEGFEMNSVKERVYRGFPRTMEELQATLDIFRQKKESIKNMVMNFEPLTSKYKKEVWSYLDEFFNMIENKSDVKSIFINNARQQ